MLCDYINTHTYLIFSSRPRNKKINLQHRSMAEAQNHRVELYGTAISGYSKMVECALKLKGVPYDLIEEDLKNKSEALLRLNPVHKKVPVLVVDGRPLAESLVILQFIDEKWKEPPLLPADPYRRAKLLFWVDFVYKKLAGLTYAIMSSEGEAQKKAAEEFAEHVATLEGGVREDLWSGAGPFINGEKPGLLDVIMGSSRPGTRCLEELAGAKLVAEEKAPLLWSAMEAFGEVDALKGLLIPKEVLLEYMVSQKKKFPPSPQA